MCLEGPGSELVPGQRRIQRPSANMRGWAPSWFLCTQMSGAHSLRVSQLGNKSHGGNGRELSPEMYVSAQGQCNKYSARKRWMWAEDSELVSWRETCPGLGKMGRIPGEASNGRHSRSRAEAGGRIQCTMASVGAGRWASQPGNNWHGLTGPLVSCLCHVRLT